MWLLLCRTMALSKEGKAGHGALRLPGGGGAGSAPWTGPGGDGCPAPLPQLSAAASSGVFGGCSLGGGFKWRNSSPFSSGGVASPEPQWAPAGYESCPPALACRTALGKLKRQSVQGGKEGCEGSRVRLHGCHRSNPHLSAVGLCRAPAGPLGDAHFVFLSFSLSSLRSHTSPARRRLRGPPGPSPGCQLCSPAPSCGRSSRPARPARASSRCPAGPPRSAAPVPGPWRRCWPGAAALWPPCCGPAGLSPRPAASPRSAGDAPEPPRRPALPPSLPAP